MSATATAPAPGEQVSARVEALVEQVRRFWESELESPPPASGSDLAAMALAVDLLRLAFARRAAAFSATDEYDRRGAVSPAAWLRDSCHLTRESAGGAVTAGQEVACLPASQAAVDDGRIGYDHLVLIARTAEAVRAAEQPFSEQDLLRAAELGEPTRFRADCERVRHAADAAHFLAERRRVEGTRSLVLRRFGDDGCWVVRGYLDPVGGVQLAAALEPLARRLGPEDDRLPAQRLADALVELATADGERRGAVPHLQVTASLETLAQGPGAGGGQLTSQRSPEEPVALAGETVRRFACNASVSRILFGPGSAIVDVGRERRVPSGPMRRALASRDGHCRWPRCRRPGTVTQPHHLTHWVDGGPTGLDNLLSLCPRHHWMCHEGGWRIVVLAGGEIRVIPPVERPP